jgi:thiamine pyrophosphate-dependent acetolactate synthase large subunit-like protein
VLVAEAVGRVLAGQGVRHVFGVIGSGNFHATNALVAGGAQLIAAAHEGGAASMADAYARVSGQVGVLSVHQGPGLTNAMTGITEAAKSRTPLLVLTPQATQPASNFYLDLDALAGSVGASVHRVQASTVRADVLDAYARAEAGATVLLALPLDLQSTVATGYSESTMERALDEVEAVVARRSRVGRTPDVTELVAALATARRPVFIAGRGAARRPDAARAALTRLADRCGALLAVSAAAKGLFAGDPWYLDVSGGFATPLAAELIGQADLVVAWGSTLNMWTTRHGTLLGPDARLAQVDVDPAAIGRNRKVHLGVVGELCAVADACLDRLAAAPGWRTPELAARITAEGQWRSVSYVDDGEPGRIDPRTLTIGLDDLLPAQRCVAVDSGNFMGYPAMFLDVPDSAGFCFTQAFQSIGLGLASAIGAAVARPGRLTVAALGDGGFLMSVAELTTAVRLGLPLLVVVYNDAAYGAEVHHFGPDGHRLDIVRFPDTDLAAIGRGFGCEGVTVRAPGDLTAVAGWLAGPRDRPLVIDAKVTTGRGSWWLEEAFRGH